MVFLFLLFLLILTVLVRVRFYFFVGKSIRIKVKVLFFSFTLVPSAKQEKHKKKQEKTNNKPSAETVFFLLRVVRNLLARIKIHRLHISFMLSADSNETTATLYGVSCALLAPLTGLLCAKHDEKNIRIRIRPLFDGQSAAKLYAAVSLRPLDVIKSFIKEIL